jgi:hypothetical protein
VKTLELLGGVITVITATITSQRNREAKHATYAQCPSNFMVSLGGSNNAVEKGYAVDASIVDLILTKKMNQLSGTANSLRS